MKDLSSMQIHSKESLTFTNPLLILLSGENVNSKFKVVKELFRTKRNALVLGQINGDSDSLAGNDAILSFIYSEDTQELSYNASILEAEIRKIKQGRYQNNNDLTVCLFLDSTSENIQWDELCCCLYELLTKAYYNRVTFDIFYLLLENFVPGSDREKNNREAARIISQIDRSEWIRYIFLLSDVTDDGQLIANEDCLFKMCVAASCVINSVPATQTVSQLQDTLLREAENSKFFALGHSTFSQTEQDVRKMVLAEITSQLSMDIRSKKHVPRKPFFLGGLRTHIFTQVSQESEDLHYIGFYTYELNASAMTLTNADFLGSFFHDNPTIYMEEVEKRCNKNLSVNINSSWGKVRAWLGELLMQSNASICIPGCEREIVIFAERELDDYLKQIQDRYANSHERFVRWKNQIVQVRKRFHRLDSLKYAYELLEEWRAFVVEEISYKLLMTAVQIIRNYIELWQEEIIHKCELFADFRDEQIFEWENMLYNSKLAANYLLDYRKKELSSFMKQNEWKMEGYRNQLNTFLLKKQVDISDITNLISNCVDQIIHEGQVAGYAWATVGIPIGLSNQHIENNFEVLADMLQEDISLNTRIRFTNSESYLCFWGPKQDLFVKYIQQHNGQPYVLVFDNYVDLSGFFCFQHLDSGKMFFWKEFEESAGA